LVMLFSHRVRRPVKIPGSCSADPGISIKSY
jgi:hypothetical protein